MGNMRLHKRKKVSYLRSPFHILKQKINSVERSLDNYFLKSVLTFFNLYHSLPFA